MAHPLLEATYGLSCLPWPAATLGRWGRPSNGAARAVLTAGVGSLLLQRSAANKFTMNVDEALYDLTPTVFTVVSILLTILGSGGSIWAWCSYLESRPSYAQMRNYMLVILAAATAFELSLCLFLHVHWWMGPLILLANGWGLLDAVIRFPVAHELDSFFSLKQIALLVGKVMIYAVGFIDVLQSKVSLFASLVVNIIALPLIYFLALPLEEEEAAAPAGRVVDVDIAVRLMQIASNQQEQQELALACRRKMRSSLAWLARASPFAEEMLVRSDPSMTKVVWKNVDI